MPGGGPLHPTLYPKGQEPLKSPKGAGAAVQTDPSKMPTPLTTPATTGCNVVAGTLIVDCTSCAVVGVVASNSDEHPGAELVQASAQSSFSACSGSELAPFSVSSCLLPPESLDMLACGSVEKTNEKPCQGLGMVRQTLCARM